MRARAPSLVLLAALAGCGDPLVGGDFRPPYLTITANVHVPPGVKLPSQINVALLWYNDQGLGQSFASDVLSFSGVAFPVSWKLGAQELPPPAAIHPVPPAIAGLDPSLRFAYGTIVAYADNGNGRFDIDPSDGTRSPDKVLGALPLVDVYYLAQGRPAPAAFLGILPTENAFSLVQQPTRSDPAVGECDLFDGHGHLQSLCEQELDGAPALLAFPATVEFPLGPGDADLQRYACASFWGPNEYPDWILAPPSEICDGPQCKFCRGYNCPDDIPPAGAPVHCTSDGLEYSYKICSNDPSRCGTRFCHYGHGARLATDPRPADWPCP